MRRRIKLAVMPIVSFMLVLGTSLVARAQERSPYVISAKAGGINAVVGTVTKARGDSVQQVSTADELDSGDRLATASDGRVEMLLMPGSYLRLAENSEIELTNASLEWLRLKLVRGMAQIEVTGDDDSRSLIEITTPQTNVRLERKGLYRVSLPSTNATLVRVRKGRAEVGATTVKDGKEITVDQNRVESISKFDKKSEDAFDAWDAQRSQTLTDANRRLSSRSAYSSYGRSGWGRNSFGGYWVYDSFFGSRTFLPYYTGWSSPYGHRYHLGFGVSRHNHRFGFFGSSGPRLGGFGMSSHRHVRIVHRGHRIIH